MATQNYPEEQAIEFPPQSYPPPKGQPPLYNHSVDPPGHNYQPQSVATSSHTVMVQPAAVNTSSVPHPETGNICLAAFSLVLSLITLTLCAGTFFLLPCIIPGFILAVVAMTTKGSSQKKYAGISIGFSVATFVSTVVLAAIIAGTIFGIITSNSR